MNNKGNPLPIEIEMKGETIKINLICPICGNDGYWLSEDHTLLLCAKCNVTMGQSFTEVDSEVGWVTS